MTDINLFTEGLFHNSYSRNRYVPAMSKDMLNFSIRCFYMDDTSLRPVLRATDTFAPIRRVWKICINHYRSNYIPRPYVTIEGQPLGFTGRY